MATGTDYDALAQQFGGAFDDMVPTGGVTGGIFPGAVPENGPQSQTPELDAYRAQARSKGIRVDDGDANLMASPDFQSWRQTGIIPPPQAQSGGLSAFSRTAPQAISPFTEQFAAPTLEQATATPGFQFRLGEGLKALERRASSGGTLNLPGTRKALTAFAQDLASAEYGNVYDRALGEYENRFNIHRANEGDRFGSERSNRLDDRSMYESDRGFGRSTFESDRGFGEQQRLNDFDIWRSQDTDQWGRQLSLAELGLRAVGGAGAAGQNYATSASDLITGAGNANAAGQVASGNAWNNAFGNIANNAMTMAMLRSY